MRRGIISRTFVQMCDANNGHTVIGSELSERRQHTTNLCIIMTINSSKMSADWVNNDQPDFRARQQLLGQNVWILLQSKEPFALRSYMMDRVDNVDSSEISAAAIALAASTAAAPCCQHTP